MTETTQKLTLANIKILDGSNYRIWAARMRSELTAESLWETVKPSRTLASNGLDEDERKIKHAKAFNMILRTVNDYYAAEILKYHDRPEIAWAKLEDIQ